MTKTSRFFSLFFGVLTNDLKKLSDLYISLIFQNFSDMKKFFQRFTQYAYIHCKILGLNKWQKQNFFITFKPFFLFLWLLTYIILKNDRVKIAQKAFCHVSKWPFIQNIHENSCIFYKYSFYVLP